jgi:GNAT superfamily N-acetyltransferase
VASAATGTASWTRRQVLAEDASGRVGAWASVHDRAAGRSVVEVVVAPDVAAADELAADLFRWAATTALDVAEQRGLTGTQLDSGAYATDERQRGWLADAGYRQTRTWLQMSRPVEASEAEPGALPAPREGVTVRRVAKHDDGLPVAADLQTVHRMLEESFADHFNSYRESFPEFVQRLREDPGHRWDHWWIATIDVDGEQVPGGALVSSVLSADEQGVEGSYIDYIGVHRRSRGRGVAKALLHTVITDAASRGRNRVGLEVDADSPTGADGLYRSMGWATKYETESWHRDVTVEGGA